MLTILADAMIIAARQEHRPDPLPRRTPRPSSARRLWRRVGWL